MLQRSGIMSAVLEPVREIDLHQRGNRERLARMGVSLFDPWQGSAPDQASLLGLLPDIPDLLARAGHLLGIHKALRIMFPHDRDLAYRWVTTPNRRFGDRMPLETMKQAYEGILAVRRFLDFERGRQRGVDG